MGMSTTQETTPLVSGIDIDIGSSVGMDLSVDMSTSRIMGSGLGTSTSISGMGMDLSVDLGKSPPSEAQGHRDKNIAIILFTGQPKTTN